MPVPERHDGSNTGSEQGMLNRGAGYVLPVKEIRERIEDDRLRERALP